MLLSLLGGTMVCSVWASNLLWVLLCLNWLLEGRWAEKWQMLKQSRPLHLYIAMFFLMALAMLWTENIGAGMEILQVSLPLLLVPLVILTTKPVTGKAIHSVLFVYITTLFVVSVIALVRLLTIPDLPYRDAVPYISHIRFALNCCMAIFILVANGPSTSKGHRLHLCLRLLLVVWFLVFLTLIRSYTAVAVLLTVSLFATLVYYRRWWTVALWLLVVGSGIAVVGIEVKSYYNMCPLATEPLRPLTANGRPYDHARDGVIENGNYVNNYVCSPEMRTAWEQRSQLPYDSLLVDGYSVEPILIRYLNAMGLTKDSAGVAAMTDAQIAAVEQGIANPVYNEGNTLRKMVYVMLFEREHYVHTRAVKGFTILQRFELWNATEQVIAEHPWFGVGTGDAVDAMHAQLEASQSELAGTGKRSHSQYLTFITMFGLVGFAVLLFFFLRAVWRKHGTYVPLLFVWTVTVLISFITEDTLDTLAGILFCTWFLAFRGEQK